MSYIDEDNLLNLHNNSAKEDLDEMLEAGLISEDQYNKIIVTLAYDYALNGNSDECLLMLINIKSDYFKKEALDHFKDDQEFFDKCIFLFEVLTYLGHIEYDVLATQPLGKA